MSSKDANADMTRAGWLAGWLVNWQVERELKLKTENNFSQLHCGLVAIQNANKIITTYSHTYPYVYVYKHQLKYAKKKKICKLYC